MSNKPTSPNAPPAEDAPGGSLAAFEREARRFNYFRLIYLLERLFPDAPRIGHTGPARDEMIRVRGEPSLIFGSSDVTELSKEKFPDGKERVQVSAAFLG